MPYFQASAPHRAYGWWRQAIGSTVYDIPVAQSRGGMAGMARANACCASNFLCENKTLHQPLRQEYKTKPRSENAALSRPGIQMEVATPTLLAAIRVGKLKVNACTVIALLLSLQTFPSPRR